MDPYVATLIDLRLPPEAAPPRLSRMKYTSSAIMFYWGLDRVYPQLQTHNIFLGADYRTSFDRIFKDHLLPQDPGHLPFSCKNLK